jgi:hypothetical protein
MTSALCLSGASSEGARQLGRAVAIGAIRALLRQIHNRVKHTINPELLISGLRVGMFVILGESWRCFFCAPYADTQGQGRGPRLVVGASSATITSAWPIRPGWIVNDFLISL